MSSATKFIASIARSSSSYRMSRILSSNTVVFKPHGLTQSLANRYLSNYTRMQNYNIHRRNFSAYNSVQPGAPLPSQPPSSNPLSWILGTVLTIILGNKLGPLLQFKNEVDTTVETVEEIVELVEKVAEIVDKVAEDISNDLPEDGNLKKVVDVVEDVAEKTAKDAHTVEDAIDKFQELEDKVEKIVGALSDDGNEHPKEAENEK